MLITNKINNIVKVFLLFRTAATTLLPLTLAACATPYLYPSGSHRQGVSLHADYALMNDGYRLPLSVWPSMPSGDCHTVLLALHGLNDYRHAFADLGPYLAGHGVTVYAYDQRGFGETEGAGYWHGRKRLVADLRGMIALLHGEHPGCPLYVLGESMGGAIVLAAQRNAPLAVRGEVLVAPAVWSRDSMPWYQRAGLWLGAHTLPGKRLTGEGLELHPSDNIAMLRALGRDPDVIKATRIDVLYGVTNLMDVAASVPVGQLGKTLLLYGMHDDIIPSRPACRFLGRLDRESDSPVIKLYPQGYHMLTRDLNAHTVWEDIVRWLQSPGSIRWNRQAVDRFCGDVNEVQPTTTAMPQGPIHCAGLSPPTHTGSCDFPD